MPELPDVETFCRYLKRTALHERVRNIPQLSERMLKSVSPATLRQRVKGHRLEQAYRHGKHLFVQLNEESGWLVLHFGMTGFLKYYRDREHAPAHPRLTLDLDNGYHLAYDCQRMLGEIGWTSDPKEYAQGHQLGPDALTLAPKQFVELLSGKRGAIKSALMNQSLLSGIGNVYSDEILFHARIHPKASVQQLSADELRALHRSLEKILQQAIEAKADPRNVPHGWLLPRRNEGGPCPQCGTPLDKQTISSRSAWLCPKCQRPPHQ